MASPIDKYTPEYVIEYYSKSKDNWDDFISEFKSHDWEEYPPTMGFDWRAWRCKRCAEIIQFGPGITDQGMSQTGHRLNAGLKKFIGFPGYCRLRSMMRALS